MGADDAWSAEIKRLPLTPDPDPLALDDDLADRLLDGDLSPDQAPTGYAEVAALLAATIAPPSPAELAGHEAALAELRAVNRARRADSPGERQAEPASARWAAGRGRGMRPGDHWHRRRDHRDASGSHP